MVMISIQLHISNLIPYDAEYSQKWLEVLECVFYYSKIKSYMELVKFSYYINIYRCKNLSYITCLDIAGVLIPG